MNDKKTRRVIALLCGLLAALIIPGSSDDSHSTQSSSCLAAQANLASYLSTSGRCVRGDDSELAAGA